MYKLLQAKDKKSTFVMPEQIKVCLSVLLVKGTARPLVPPLQWN